MKCTYCGEEFESEESYRAHLGDEHADELGAIDRRRVDRAADDTDSSPIGILAIAIVLIVAGSVVVYTVFLADSSSTAGDTLESQPLPENGNASLLTDVEQLPSEGREHVPAGTEITYETMPPASGPHYDQTASAGFYTDRPQLGALVHSLEHGAVVVYYDPERITPDARESLERFAATHTGTWQSVIVVPTPVDDPSAPYILTAWRHKLSLDSYDRDTVRAFLAEYLGRGPENPVR
jgi:hypothetical protein